MFNIFLQCFRERKTGKSMKLQGSLRFVRIYFLILNFSQLSQLDFIQFGYSFLLSSVEERKSSIDISYC